MTTANPPGDLLQLLDRLKFETESGRIKWTTDGEGSQRVNYYGQSGQVSIFPKDWDDRTPMVLNVYDNAGDLVTKYVAEYTIGDSGDYELAPFALAIVDLYRTARDAASASVINSLLRELDT